MSEETSSLEVRPIGTRHDTEAPEKVEEFAFVEMPDGSIKAVPRSQVHSAPVPTDAPDVPKTQPQEQQERHYYVHLANGDVKRAKESDLPAAGGTNAPYGHWQTGGQSHHIIGIYPVEE